MIIFPQSYKLQEISQPFHKLAHFMHYNIEDGPEKSARLRKLLEAKDCMVRAYLQGDE